MWNGPRRSPSMPGYARLEATQLTATQKVHLKKKRKKEREQRTIEKVLIIVIFMQCAVKM